MEELMKKYGLSLKDMMLIASLDNLTSGEMNDLGYIEDRIQTHDFKKFKPQKTKSDIIRILAEKNVTPQEFSFLFSAVFGDVLQTLHERDKTLYDMLYHLEYIENENNIEISNDFTWDEHLLEAVALYETKDK